MSCYVTPKISVKYSSFIVKQQTEAKHEETPKHFFQLAETEFTK